jgi:hypothetical protein
MKLTRILPVASIFSLAAAGSALAQTTFTDTGTVTMGTPSMSVKPSKNVTVIYTPSTSTVPSGNGALAYAIASFHASGSKSFGSSSGDTKIFATDGTGNTGLSSPEAAGASAGFSTGWTAL